MGYVYGDTPDEIVAFAVITRIRDGTDALMARGDLSRASPPGHELEVELEAAARLAMKLRDRIVNTPQQGGAGQSSRTNEHDDM